MVVEGALVVVGVLGARVPLEEVARELEHVVGVAGLGRVRAQRLRELLLGREHLAVAVSADDVGSLLDHGVPEEARGGLERFLAGELVLARGADELGDLGVRVQAGQGVSPLGGRVQDGLVVEPLGELEVLGLAGPGVEIRQGLVHAAVLVAEHRLHLRVAQAVGPRLDPVGELAGDVQRLLAL